MIFSAFKKVFGRKRYLVIAVLVSFVVFTLSTWLPNLGLVWYVITSDTVSFTDKITILAGLLASIQTNFSIFSSGYTIAISLLFGINTAMVAYYIRQRGKLVKEGVTSSAVGFLSGLFGIGCAACSALVIGPLLSLIGAGGLVAILPLAGQEFGILGVGILGLSIFLTSKKIESPLLC